MGYVNGLKGKAFQCLNGLYIPDLIVIVLLYFPIVYFTIFYFHFARRKDITGSRQKYQI